MAVFTSTGRSLAWGGLAATVLLLNQVGVLDEILGVAAPSIEAAQAEDPVDDRLMSAQEEALATLPRFMDIATSAPSDWKNMALRVEFSDGGESEALWVDQFRQVQGDLYQGRLTTDADRLDSLSQGQSVVFRHEQISDWSFEKGGRGYGYFTVHAALPMMADGQAAMLRGFLAEKPLPQDW